MLAPNLITTLGPRLTLPTPVLAAPGTFGWGDELTDLTDTARVGGWITPTLTLEARRGNPMPRTAEASAGLLHATGLPNPGIHAFLTERVPMLQALPAPCIVSIAGETANDWKVLGAALEDAPGIAALELNLTPLPLLVTERADDPMPSEAALLESITAAIAAVRAVSSRPILARLPSMSAEIGILARAAADAGADIISVAQAFPGLAVRLSSRQFRFPGVVGGLSGPCIKPLALYQVWRVAQTVSLPIIGGGGIMTAEDALEFFFAGASAVMIGTASLIHPSAISRVTDDLAAYLAAKGAGSIRELFSAS